MRAQAVFHGSAVQARALIRTHHKRVVSLVVCGDMVSGRLTGPIGTAVAANVRNVVKLAELAVKYGEGEGAQRVLPLAR